MHIKLTSPKLIEVQEVLSSWETQSSKKTLTELEIPDTVQSIDEIYDHVKHYSHGAYITLWLFGLLAKDEISWALEQEELVLFFKDLEALPQTLLHVPKIKKITLAYNPITDFSILTSFPHLKEVVISISQKEHLPEGGFLITYACVVTYGIDRATTPLDFADVEMVPDELKESKRQYLLETPESKEKAIQLVRPFISTFYIGDSVSVVADEEFEYPMFLDEEDAILTHLDVHFSADGHVPEIGAAGCTCFHLSENPLESSERYSFIQDNLWEGVMFQLYHPDEDEVRVFEGYTSIEIREPPFDDELKLLEERIFPSLMRVNTCHRYNQDQADSLWKSSR